MNNGKDSSVKVDKKSNAEKTGEAKQTKTLNSSKSETPMNVKPEIKAKIPIRPFKQDPAFN